MKKLISALAALCRTLCLTGTVFAASGTDSGTRDSSALPGSSSIDVTAECHIDVNYYEIILGTSSDTVTLPDDIALRGFSPKQENNGLRVIIIPVTAADWPQANDWAARQVRSLGKEPVIYYLMFYRGTERQESAEDVTITMSARSGYESALLYHMDGSARTNKLSYAKTDNGPSFAMTKNGYYVFLKANSGGYYYHPTTPSTTPSAATTGDAGIAAYIVCAAVSAAGIARIGRKRK